MRALAALAALAVLYLVIAVKAGRRREVRRRAELARAAAEPGMGSAPGGAALLSRFGGLASFPHGERQRATSVMRGIVRGSPAALFDNHATLGGGSGRDEAGLTAAAFDLSSKPLPVFEAQGG